MKRAFALCCIALTLAAAERASLATRINTLLDEGQSAKAFWGVLAVDLKDGHVVYARNEHRMFAPASNTKLFTTATALELLGPDYKFRTTVEAAVAPVDGAVAGDLTLVGRGDPNLSPRVLPYAGHTETAGATTVALDRIVDQLLAGGLKSVGGDVIGDDSFFRYERYGDGWTVDDTIWSYGAPISALTVNDNELRLDVTPSNAGSMASVKLDPYANYFTIDNRVKTIAKGLASHVHINREPGSRTIEVWGEIAAEDKIFHEVLAVDDPAELAAHYLRDALITRGVEVKGGAKARHLRALDTVAEPEASVVLATVESRTLADDIKVIHKTSQNLHTEMLLRDFGHGSVAGGLAEEKIFLRRAGLDKDEFYFLDGSGLSRAGLVAPAATVRLLTYMYASPNRDVWVDSLPVAGVDGSLLKRLKGDCTMNNVEAKTGSFRHVAALSGYMTASHGHHLAFSIMVNNYNMPAKDATGVMDKVIDELCRAQ